MPTENDYETIHLLSILQGSGNSVIFERLISNFNSINADVDFFLKNSAIQSVKLKTSATYLVLDNQNSEDLVGYFTLATKMLTVKKSILSNSKIRIFERFGYYDKDSDSYKLPAILLAQLSKNFHSASKSISGSLLLHFALKQVDYIMSLSSGKTVFLECEETAALIDFYKQNGFVFLDNAVTSKNNKDLIQMYRLL